MREKVLFSWSGGKDSSLALSALLHDPNYEVVGLLTTLSSLYRRVSHHGFREELLERQAEHIGLPLFKLYLPADQNGACINLDYERFMEAQLCPFVEQGVSHVAHGDIFLQDLRDYREKNLSKLGLKGLFPIWKRDTRELIDDFISRGFQAYLTCVDGVKLGRNFAGRLIDESLMRDLPPGVDPCGENGEYHSFVFAGPIFRRPIGVKLGEIVERETRFYADLLPIEAEELLTT